MPCNDSNWMPTSEEEGVGLNTKATMCHLTHPKEAAPQTAAPYKHITAISQAAKVGPSSWREALLAADTHAPRWIASLAALVRTVAEGPPTHRSI